jgi:hypothetical protein
VIYARREGLGKRGVGEVLDRLFTIRTGRMGGRVS